MKIKRFNNLWTMGLILCGVILGIIYFFKLFFPQTVIEIAQIDSITKIGHYIDNHKWAWYLATTILSFCSYFLTCCASCKKYYLDLKEIIIILISILILFFVKEFVPSQYTSLNISITVLLPFIMGADFKATVVMFVSTNFLQTMTLQVRNLSLMISDYNFATLTILMLDYYIFMILLYLFFNYKKGEQYGNT